MIQNFFSSKNFDFTIGRLPNVEFFVQSVNIPGLTIPITEQYTPFTPVHRPGNKMQFDELSVTVRMDENLLCYKEIYNWMVGMTSPRQFSEYANLIVGDGVFSDASLVLLNSKGNAIKEFKFIDLFPVSIGSMQLSTVENTTQFVTCTINFKYTTFVIVDI
jgi:hypothetical protein